MPSVWYPLDSPSAPSRHRGRRRARPAAKIGATIEAASRPARAVRSQIGQRRRRPPKEPSTSAKQISRLTPRRCARRRRRAAHRTAGCRDGAPAASRGDRPESPGKPRANRSARRVERGLERRARTGAEQYGERARLPRELGETRERRGCDRELGLRLEELQIGADATFQLPPAKFDDRCDLRACGG